MDRDFIVKVCNDYYIRKDITCVNDVLFNYCLEHGKKPKEIYKFISIIFSTMSWIPYFEYALEYYKRKFVIYELLRIGTNMIQNQKSILLIY